MRPVTATRLILVRHGESNATVAQIVAGERACSGLSALGRRQSAALAARFRREGLRADALYASTLPRAYETADALAEALGRPVARDAELVEHRPGAADGCPFADFDRRFGMFDFRAEPDRPFAPGGESQREFHNRVVAALGRITELHAAQTVVVVCHGGVIDAAFRHHLALDLANPINLWTLNTSLTEFVLAADAKVHLRRYNDAAHLADVEDEEDEG